jgi:hypothetical protein
LPGFRRFWRYHVLPRHRWQEPSALAKAGSASSLLLLCYSSNVDHVENILRGLQDTMSVMEGLQRRQADRLQDHQQWLEALNTAWSRHNTAWQRHEEWLQGHEAAWREHQEWLVAHDRAMAEIDVKLNSLIEAVNRFVQGRNRN